MKPYPRCYSFFEKQNFRFFIPRYTSWEVESPANWGDRFAKNAKFYVFRKFRIFAYSVCKKMRKFSQKKAKLSFFSRNSGSFFQNSLSRNFAKSLRKTKKFESFVRWKTSRYNITKDFDIEQSLSPRTNQLYSKCTIISIYYVNMTLERARIKTWRPYVNQTNLTNFNWDFLLIVL